MARTPILTTKPTVMRAAIAAAIGFRRPDIRVPWYIVVGEARARGQRRVGMYF